MTDYHPTHSRPVLHPAVPTPILDLTTLRDCSYWLPEVPGSSMRPVSLTINSTRAYKAHQLYSSPRCAETLTVNSISEKKKRCSQFDALGNHVMKNRLLRIRISQALPHCIELSRAE